MLRPSVVDCVFILRTPEKAEFKVNNSENPRQPVVGRTPRPSSGMRPAGRLRGRGRTVRPRVWDGAASPGGHPSASSVPPRRRYGPGCRTRTGPERRTASPTAPGTKRTGRGTAREPPREPVRAVPHRPRANHSWACRRRAFSAAVRPCPPAGGGLLPRWASTSAMSPAARGTGPAHRPAAPCRTRRPRISISRPMRWNRTPPTFWRTSGRRRKL